MAGFFDSGGPVSGGLMSGGAGAPTAVTSQGLASSLLPNNVAMPGQVSPLGAGIFGGVNTFSPMANQPMVGANANPDLTMRVLNMFWGGGQQFPQQPQQTPTLLSGINPLQSLGRMFTPMPYTQSRTG